MTYDENFSVIQGKPHKLTACPHIEASGHFGKPSRFANFRNRRENHPDERIRTEVCTRVEVIFCVLDPLSFFFCQTTIFPRYLSILSLPFLFPLYSSSKPSQPTFFPRPLLFLPLHLPLSLRIYARKVRHAARDTLLA